MAEYPVEQLIADIAMAVTPADFHDAFLKSCDVFDRTNTELIAGCGSSWLSS